jgi:4-hydroxybenzoate polyprenyltransferase
VRRFHQPLVVDDDTLAYDTIYACQDRDDDARIGIKSTALLFGKRIRWWISRFYLLGMSAIVLAYAWAEPPRLWSILVLACAAGLLYWQTRVFDPGNSARCLQQFKQHALFGALVSLAFLG